MIRPYKFTLVTHALVYDDEGEIVDERATEPMVFVGLPALLSWLDVVQEQMNEGVSENGVHRATRTG